MPLLKGKLQAPAKPVVDLRPEDTVYVIPHTGEQFLSKEDFDERQTLYNEAVWTCQCTGVTKLTHKEAVESEKKIRRLLADEFPSAFERHVLELVHQSSCSLEHLVDDAWRSLHEFFVIGESVTLKVKAHGKIIRGKIVKVDQTIAEKPVNEDGQSLASPQKEPSAENSPRKAPKLRTCKYGVHVDEEDKIISGIPSSDLTRESKLPKKDLIRFFIRAHAVRSGNQSNSSWIIDNETASRFSLPGKSCAVLSSLSESHDRKLKENIQNTKKRKGKGLDENCKPSKKQKLDVTDKKLVKKKTKGAGGIQQTLNLCKTPCVVSISKLDGNCCSGEGQSKESQSKEGQSNDPTNSQLLKVASKNNRKITAFINSDLKRSDSVSSNTSSCEVPLSKLRRKIQGENGAPSTSLSGENVKQSLDVGTGKKNAENSASQSAPASNNDPRRRPALEAVGDDDSSSFDVPLAKLRTEAKEGIAEKNGAEPVNSKQSRAQNSPSKSSKTKESSRKSNSVTLYSLTSPKSVAKKDSSVSSPKKKLKQMTLFDMKQGGKGNNSSTVGKSPPKSPGKVSKPAPRKSKEKGPTSSSIAATKSGEKTLKSSSSEKDAQSAADGPNVTPKKSSSDVGVKKAAKTPLLTPSKNLPPIVARFQKVNKEANPNLYFACRNRCARELSEKQILSLPDNLRSVILEKFNKMKEKQMLDAMTPEEKEAYFAKKKQELKEQSRTKVAESKKRFEDTTLELKPLPSPKIVATPDGLANELFGDVAMVAEFILCFRGLLMPNDSVSITTEKLMAALVAGKDGFSYLSRILCILLQTLLQDKLAEDYKELQTPLSEIPVSEYTASELMRLSLRKSDPDADDADDLSSLNNGETKPSEENEVSELLIEQLENNDFCDLEVEAKVQILVGLCNRIMGTYSVQDFIEQKQQEASELWKRRMADFKEKKTKKKTEEKAGKTDKQDKKSPSADAGTKSEANKGSGGLTIDHFYGDKSNGAKQTSSGNAPAETTDDSEDMLSAIKRRRRAAEERKQKESEDRLLKEKERFKVLQEKEDMQFEIQFKKGIEVAKSVLRLRPIGLDRNHSRYWVFHGSQPGLYVEKGWASRESDYFVRHEMSSSESESDGRSAESGIHSRSSNLSKDSLDEQTIPHIGQNLWFLFDSVEEIKTLMENLHPLGVRESSLHKSLENVYDSLAKRLQSSAAKSSEVCDKSESSEKLVQGLQEEMLDFELRLVHGGLGGVSDLAAWKEKLSAASDIKDFVECLIDIQLHVLPKFMKGALTSQDGTQKKRSSDNADENKADEESAKAEDKVVDGLKTWLDALGHCSTYSRLHVLMGILESCIRWEKSAENIKCRICRKKGSEESLLLCDECNMPFHLFCLRPVLLEVPMGEWFCPACNPERSSHKTRSRFQARKETMEESDDEDEGIADLEHEQECAVCGEDGDLIQCSTCPSSFHLDCHDPPVRHVPRSNTWKCVQCKTGVRLRKSRRNRGQKRKRYVDYIAEEDDLEEEVVETRRLKKASTVSDLRKTNSTEVTNGQSHRRRTLESDCTSDRPAGSGKHETAALRHKTNGELAASSGFKLRSASVRLTEIDEQSMLKLHHQEDGKNSQKIISSKDGIDKQMILELVDRLRKNRHSWPFLEPVDVEDAPDYYTLILDPIDLRTMEDKCISDVYANSQEFIADFILMLQNAEKYNERDSPVGKCVAPMDKFFESIVKRYIPECKYTSRNWFSAQD